MHKTQVHFFLGLLHIILIFSTFWFVPVDAAISWNVQVVDFDATGGYAPIVLDYDGTSHVAYTGYNPPYDRLVQVKYASWNGSDWHIQTIAGGRALNLVFDSHNNPHILYHDPWQKSLMYASWTGINWSTQTVDEKAGSGVVALDSSDNPHVAYLGDGLLKYASWTGTNWIVQTIDSLTEGSVGSLVFDSNNTPHIFYDNTISVPSETGAYQHVENLKHAVMQGPDWNLQYVANASGFGNMVLDSRDYPHLIYHLKYPEFGGTGNSTLVYARWNGVTWETQTVVSGIDLDSESFLALDFYDYPHISYFSGEALMYAGWTGAAWIIQSVDSGIASRGPSGIIVDSNCIAHISFLANPPGTPFGFRAYLMYATASEAFPSVINVDSNSTVTAFAFDEEKSELTFDVSGESGSTGYANVSIAKSYLGNVDNSKVYVGGKQVDYQVSSNEDSWVLAFTYQHSTHQVRVEFASFPILLTGGIVTATIVIALAGLATYWKKNKNRSK